MISTEALVSHILLYLHYLQENCGFSVTLHEFQNVFAPYLVQFLPYRVHSNPYCLYLKSNAQLWDDCISRQGKILKKLSEGPFWGVCHCGVLEYVYPIAPGGRVIGFISVSGYRGGLPESEGKVRHICRKYMLDEGETTALYCRCLSPDPLDTALLVPLSYPLAQMLELLAGKRLELEPDSPAGGRNADEVLTRVLQHIEKNYHRPISLEELAQVSHCSRSYISHMFKAKTGHTLREYTNLLRLEEAKKILLGTAASITEAAARAGFENSNYFSLLFRRQTGMSPSQYRRSGGGMEGEAAD